MFASDGDDMIMHMLMNHGSNASYSRKPIKEETYEKPNSPNTNPGLIVFVLFVWFCSVGGHDFLCLQELHFEHLFYYPPAQADRAQM